MHQRLPPFGVLTVASVAFGLGLLPPGPAPLRARLASAACPEAASDAMAQMPEDPQMRLTPLRPGTPADSARAKHFVERMRELLAKYQDVRIAEADGYKQYLRDLTLPYYHFTSWRRAIDAMVRFDPARPTSLLYGRDPDGSFHLWGAMYTAPAGMSDDDLDALVPLSLARWHQHLNWCVPVPTTRNRPPDTHAGGPIPGISTRAGCDSVGGRFRPRLFDWSIHIYAFAGDDPKAIWCVDHQDMKMSGE
ncbi:MAG TPA: hypothetical protein VN848_05590 [Gemmatimonadales bacterium]|nr:hypothetical protein [Gemmatimonadales bacterium]